jgi:hypothetical protein
VQKEGGEEEYDMDLSEFREELGDLLFHRFFDENFHTVRDVIGAKRQDLVDTLAIESEKVDEIIAMLRKGLEEAEVENEEDASEALQGQQPASVPQAADQAQDAEEPQAADQAQAAEEPQAAEEQQTADQPQAADEPQAAAPPAVGSPETTTDEPKA